MEQKNRIINNLKYNEHVIHKIKKKCLNRKFKIINKFIKIINEQIKNVKMYLMTKTTLTIKIG